VRGFNANLYSFNYDPTSQYLVESRAFLTDYRQWLSSDFMLARLNSDPQMMLKRLGDGYVEQGLVREQIAALTGLRFLAGFDNDESQYMALMLAGSEFAAEFALSLGVALSAEQMALLTTNIVWLEYVSIETAEGPVQVLVPKVYLAAGQESAITPGGSLVSARNIVMELGGD